MRYTAILTSMLVLAAPLIAAAADPADDGIVILSVTPRDPAVKGEILLPPAKKATVAAGTGDAAGKSEGAPEPARTAQLAQNAPASSR